ncbi:hypothetical protein [Pseudacidobacterium ailaaui]|jgi:hypothetical protein|uniref:hypothetical protein n=1 Tax=Pseudacidobacterium ailaaui TaxID=1382359 RepID=UPI0032E04B41
MGGKDATSSESIVGKTKALGRGPLRVEIQRTRKVYGTFLSTACVMQEEGVGMVPFLLWCLLFFCCWPLALLALLIYPFVWLVLLPFRLAGIAVHGILDLVAAIVFLPGRLLRAI